MFWSFPYISSTVRGGVFTCDGVGQLYQGFVDKQLISPSHTQPNAPRLQMTGALSIHAEMFSFLSSFLLFKSIFSVLKF